MKTIDLNCDMGELPEHIADGTQERLMPSLTSVNIACGGHAGDAATMLATVEQALRWNLAVGAHPGYPDRENFGRRDMALSAQEISQTVFEQVRALADVARRCSVQISHVKPHGALYNQAARGAWVAQAIAEGVARWRNNVVLVGLAGSLMLEIFRGAGFSVAAEAFADRRYEPDGSLRPRRFADALITDPGEAACQAVAIVEQGIVTASDGSRVRITAQTICIHGDSPGATDIASAVARRIRNAGVALTKLL